TFPSESRSSRSLSLPPHCRWPESRHFQDSSQSSPCCWERGKQEKSTRWLRCWSSPSLPCCPRSKFGRACSGEIAPSQHRSHARDKVLLAKQPPSAVASRATQSFLRKAHRLLLRQHRRLISLKILRMPAHALSSGWLLQQLLPRF